MARRLTRIQSVACIAKKHWKKRMIELTMDDYRNNLLGKARHVAPASLVSPRAENWRKLRVACHEHIGRVYPRKNIIWKAGSAQDFEPPFAFLVGVLWFSREPESRQEFTNRLDHFLERFKTRKRLCTNLIQ